MGKTFIFSSKPRHVTPQIDCLMEKQTLFWGFQLHISGDSEDIDGKTFIFRVNLGMWPLKSFILIKQALFWEFQHPFMQFPSR